MRSGHDTAPQPLPVIDGYQVEEQIGLGGFSSVYRAWQLRFDREVAIKVLNEAFVDDGQRSEFERECKVMGRLTHPNVVRVYDSDRTHDGRGCIVMELYAGTYRDVGRLSIPEVVDVGAKIADALAEAHHKQIIHRDLKPHNLFISHRGDPALGDFGISTTVEHTGRQRFTLKYAPPELLRDGTSDAKGDIYSLGATIYQLATGSAPFTGDTDEALIEKIMAADPPQVERSDAPIELDRLLRRCLSKQPNDRPRSAGELAEEFRRIQSLVGLPARRTTGTLPSAFDARPSPGGGSSLSPGTATPFNARAGDDHTQQNEQLGRAPRGIPRDRPPVSSDAVVPPSDAGRRRKILLGATVAALGIAVAAVVIALSGGGDDPATTATTDRVRTTQAPYVVLNPPTAFAVEGTAEGFSFTWEPDDSAGVGTKVQLHRVGTDDTIIADTSPFVWNLQPLPGGSCFEARTVDADETRLSQAIAGPACAA